MLGNRGGRKTNRVTWTLRDGSKVCLEDESEMARLFKKMISVLDDRDLTAVMLAIDERRNALLVRAQNAFLADCPAPVLPQLEVAKLAEEPEEPEELEPGRKDNVAPPQTYQVPMDSDRTPEMIAEARCDSRHYGLAGSGRAAYCKLIAALIRAADDYRGSHSAHNEYLAAQAEYLDTTRGYPDGFPAHVIEKEWDDIRIGNLM